MNRNCQVVCKRGVSPSPPTYAQIATNASATTTSLPHDLKPPLGATSSMGGPLLTKEIRKWVVIMKVRMMFWFRGPVACFVHAMLNLEWWHAGRSLCGS
jgi:hypothetical protein